MAMIEVLYFEGCPNREAVVDLARQVADELGIPVEIREIEVAGPEHAERLRFLGSPSLRVDGSDIEPGADDRTEFAFSCRVYGINGLPPREMLARALRARSQ